MIIPKDVTGIKFDIGLAGDAPNSAIWLYEDLNVFVVGVEPLSYHWDLIYEMKGKPENFYDYPTEWRIVQLKHNAVMFNRTKICDINDRFYKVQAAIDNVKEPTKKIFYEKIPEHSGSSSLLKPVLISHIKDEILVDCFSLEYLIDQIDPGLKKFKYIQQIKTDCEGKDFDVIKSLGKYLDKVVYINSEVVHNNEWYNANNPKDHKAFMLANGFEIIKDSQSNIDFVNKRYKELAKTINHETLGR
jgi:hypothetical protein